VNWVSSSHDFVRKKFFDYYTQPDLQIPAPTLMNQREFAFLLFYEKIMLRHKAFVDIANLRLFFKDIVPSGVYYSCAYYENPRYDMAQKGWLGADLVFDIDADHIPTSCDKNHDEWICKSCGRIGKGENPEFCPNCHAKKFTIKAWPCEFCLDSAKMETVKLVDMLEQDFGFSKSEIQVFFSGHRGYHVHVENETVKSLGAIARKEIVDYVSGMGLELKKQGGKKGCSKPFVLPDSSWGKRLKHGMAEFIGNATKEDLTTIGIKKSSALIIMKNKDLIRDRCINKGLWSGVKFLSDKTWEKLAEHTKNLLSASIDTVVTTDIHRLIRLAGTLHGKTGLKKIAVQTSCLKDFDPFAQALAFKEGAERVFVTRAPEFRLGEKMFGPYENQKLELPTAAAILLICRNRAEVLK